MSVSDFTNGCKKATDVAALLPFTRHQLFEIERGLELRIAYCADLFATAGGSEAHWKEAIEVAEQALRLVRQA